MHRCKFESCVTNFREVSMVNVLFIFTNPVKKKKKTWSEEWKQFWFIDIIAYWLQLLGFEDKLRLFYWAFIRPSITVHCARFLKVVKIQTYFDIILNSYIRVENIGESTFKAVNLNTSDSHIKKKHTQKILSTYQDQSRN